jgi:hypothetical protein
MKQQTAVQYLLSLISKGEKLEITPTKCGHIIYAEDHIIEKVLEMEKEQIKDAFDEGENREFYKRPQAEQYYNETYNNDNA